MYPSFKHYPLIMQPLKASRSDKWWWLMGQTPLPHLVFWEKPLYIFYMSHLIDEKALFKQKRCPTAFYLVTYHSNKQSTLKGLPYSSLKVNVISIRPIFNCVGLTTFAFINQLQMPNPRGSDPFDPNRLVQKTCLSDNHHQNTQYSSPGLLLSHNLHFSLVFRAIAEEWTF